MATEIDEPIDLVAQAFQFEVGRPLSHAGFNRAILEFVRNIYQNGILLPRNLSRQEALGEAVFLLRIHYRGVHTSGYDGALLDASSSDMEGLEHVLSHLAETIKAAERRKYAEWVFVQKIGPLDWEDRCRLVSTYLERYSGLIPDQLRNMDPARLEAHFQDLIANHLSTDSWMKQVFGTDASWTAFGVP
ncbi:MAG: hypothetical protein JRK53_08965 [Deltaproteobacteria bacterium]|nr:hypothetical protein [Deltaproteobacteria bacterium]